MEWVPDVATGVAGVAVAIMGYVSAKLHRLTQTMRQVDKQVTNDHSTNLRDDVTEIHRDVERLTTVVTDGIKRLDRQHGETHRVLTQEIAERQQYQERAHAEHQAMWARINRRDGTD